MKVINTGWFNRLIARCASEAMITEMKRYNPQRLLEIRAYADRPDWPWRDEESSRIYWQTYRRLLKGMPGNEQC